jgi:hypothetical protein
MKNIVFASAIAGLISGLLSAIIVVIGRLIKLFGVLAPMENTIIFSIGWIVLTVIFCIFFGLLYKGIYDLIPGKGIMKGLFFGLLIWFIKDIAAGAYLIFTGTVVAGGLFEWITAGVNLIVMGSYMWVIYGLVLGYLYKK